MARLTLYPTSAAISRLRMGAPGMERQSALLPVPSSGAMEVAQMNAATPRVERAQDRGKISACLAHTETAPWTVVAAMKPAMEAASTQIQRVAAMIPALLALDLLNMNACHVRVAIHLKKTARA